MDKLLSINNVKFCTGELRGQRWRKASNVGMSVLLPPSSSLLLSFDEVDLEVATAVVAVVFVDVRTMAIHCRLSHD